MNLQRSLRACRRPARLLAQTLVDVVLPPVCPACGDESSSLCLRCHTGLAWRARLGCIRCGEPVLQAGQSCGAAHRELQNIARLVAPWRYAGTGGALVRRFKLDANAGAGRLLARAMADAWRAEAPEGWGRPVLVPVPLHRARRRHRGFDQAAWLATMLGAKLRADAELAVLRRTQATLPQGDPRNRSRAANVEHAFAVTPTRAVLGRRVVLVDDVFTSGATMRRCAQLLLGIGAREVAALVACRS